MSRNVDQSTSKNMLLEQLIAGHRELRRSLERVINPAELDDYLQDTALRLLEQTTHVSVERPRHYLATIVRRIAIDNYRSRWREVSLEAAPQVLETEDTQADPEQHCSDVQTHELLRQIILQLRAPARRALTLHYFHDMNCRQIGSVMGISPRTVEKHLASGKAECRSRLLRKRSLFEPFFD